MRKSSLPWATNLPTFNAHLPPKTKPIQSGVSLSKTWPSASPRLKASVWQPNWWRRAWSLFKSSAKLSWINSQDARTNLFSKPMTLTKLRTSVAWCSRPALTTFNSRRSSCPVLQNSTRFSLSNSWRSRVLLNTSNSSSQSFKRSVTSATTTLLKETVQSWWSCSKTSSSLNTLNTYYKLSLSCWLVYIGLRKLL